MRNVESTIQRELVKWLENKFISSLPLEFRSTFKYVWVRNEGNKSAASGMLDKKMGLDAGHPDLYFTFVKDDIKHIYYLELKRKKGKLSESQKDWHKGFAPAKNSKLETAKGLSESKEILNEWFNLSVK